MKQEVKIGQTDYTVLIFIPDSASTDGSGKTGLVAANLTVSGTRVETDNDVTVTDYTSSLNNLANLTATHADWGLLEVSSTLAPGLYRLDIADAIFASGAWSAVVYVMVTTSAAAASPMEFVLVPDAPITGVNVSQWNGTAVSVPTNAGVPNVNVKTWNDLTTVALPLVPATAGRTLVVDAAGLADANMVKAGPTGSGTAQTAGDIIGDTNDIQARLPAALTAGGNIKADALAWNALATVALPLTPTTAGRTLDVSAGGEAGVDWANVGSPTTVVGLSGTTVKTATDVETDTADIQARLPAALVSGRIDASVGAMAAGVITNAAFAANAISDAKVDPDVTIASVTGAVGSVTGLTASDVGAIKLKTDNLPGDPADESLIIAATDAISSSIAALTIPSANANADALLDRADGVEIGLTPRQALRLSAAADAGKLSGAATATNVIRNAVADDKDRITATVDADGNRTAITYDLT